jgi:hypothetical protein
MALRYPIPIELTLEELELAANGSFVTRVIYVEDPHQALPTAQRRDSEQPWIEAPRGEDPLVTADRYGRAVAILRIGGRVPTSAATDNACIPSAVPPLEMYDAATEYPRNCPEFIPDSAVPTLPNTRLNESATAR